MGRGCIGRLTGNPTLVMAVILQSDSGIFIRTLGMEGGKHLKQELWREDGGVRGGLCWERKSPHLSGRGSGRIEVAFW